MWHQKISRARSVRVTERLATRSDAARRRPRAAKRSSAEKASERTSDVPRSAENPEDSLVVCYQWFRPKTAYVMHKNNHEFRRFCVRHHPAELPALPGYHQRDEPLTPPRTRTRTPVMHHDAPMVRHSRTTQIARSPGTDAPRCMSARGEPRAIPRACPLSISAPAAGRPPHQ